MKLLQSMILKRHGVRMALMPELSMNTTDCLSDFLIFFSLDQIKTLYRGLTVCLFNLLPSMIIKLDGVTMALMLELLMNRTDCLCWNVYFLNLLQLTVAL